MIRIINEGSVFYDLHGYEPTPDIEAEAERTEAISDEILDVFGRLAVKQPDNTIVLKNKNSILAYLDILDDFIEFDIRNFDLTRLLNSKQLKWIRDMRDNGVLRTFTGRRPYHSALESATVNRPRKFDRPQKVDNAFGYASMSDYMLDYTLDMTEDITEELFDVFGDLAYNPYPNVTYLVYNNDVIAKFKVQFTRRFVEMIIYDGDILNKVLTPAQKEWINDMKDQRLLQLVTDNRKGLDNYVRQPYEGKIEKRQVRRRIRK